ncbi:hypothetical protein PHLGIDRAFT_120719 [Phlebiopsis gigantea 11061_1 CR5-6]|uniref:Protein kinase domain-containing protein n=1 Tax=Phlebiopsis gigantea (strain 11061_1 CR5-6) TaxID=745531 RepID=A0A0C3PFM5_PHLG1|nr:hypothetical protein PHLGIDRAFT_120719 [Phlebiopsis gigantea 11061_1 CR5-6]
MTSQNISSAIVTSYPEENLYEMDPPVFNLTPKSMEAFLALDTPEFLQGALQQTRKTGVNPLFLMHGTSPLYLADRRLAYARLPLSAYQKPPPLPEIELPDDVAFVEQLNKQGNTVLVVVRIGGELRLVKIFPEQEPDHVLDRVDADGPESCGLRDVAVDRFEQEKQAYAHLLHYGACAKGVVPHCYGWLELTSEHRQKISAVPGGEGIIIALPRIEGPVRAILLEYFSEAVRLSYENLTEKLAEQAMRGLHQIHAAYVVHGDLHRRNILVLPGDRIVWVDFNFSRTPSGDLSCRRQELFQELHSGWCEFYSKMLPNKRIGYLY